MLSTRMLYVYLGYLFLHVIGIPEYMMHQDVRVLDALILLAVALVMSALVVSGFWLGQKVNKRYIDNKWTLLAIGFAVGVVKILLVRTGAFGFSYISWADPIAFALFFVIGALAIGWRKRPQDRPRRGS
jgi:hypothetical protein